MGIKIREKRGQNNIIDRKIKRIMTLFIWWFDKYAILLNYDAKTFNKNSIQNLQEISCYQKKKSYKM